MHAGFPWTTRIIGFMALATLMIPLCILRHHRRPTKPRQLLDVHAFKETPYLTTLVASVFIFAGIFCPYIFISSFGLIKLQLSPDLSFYLTSILNVGSFFGRLVIGGLASKYGAWRTSHSMIIICGILAFGLIGVHNLGGTIVFAVLYGFFSGGLLVVIGAIMVSLSPSLDLIGTRFGMLCGGVAFAELVGAPIASALGHVERGEFLGIQLWTGCTLIIAGVMMSWPHFLLAKKNG